MYTRWLRTSLAVLVVAAFTYLFVLNAWVGDDAYIIFRTIDNCLSGYGLRWNVAERVQSFTCPLWTLLILGVRSVTGEFYFASLGLSYIFSLATLMIAWRSGLRHGAFVVFVLALFGSRAFFDYTSSGLETPLSYVILVLFWSMLPRAVCVEKAGRWPIVSTYVVGSLAFVNRPDSVLLFIVPMGVIAWRDIRHDRLAAIGRLSIGLLPAVAWEAFAIIYYGFPFPNTFYAKVGLDVPVSTVLLQGARYFANSLMFDPVTLVIIAAGTTVCLAARKLIPTLGAVSIVLPLIYTLTIGGDFMTGRFFALPFLLAAFLGSQWMPSDRRLLACLVASLVVYDIAAPYAPIRTDPTRSWNHPYTNVNGILDEAGGYRGSTSPLLYRPFGPLFQSDFPCDSCHHAWATFGTSLREANTPVVMISGIGAGFLGFNAGPKVHIFDAFALSDPLMARLPAIASLRERFLPGHMERVFPEGYDLSPLSGTNQIVNPDIREYYDLIRCITQGDLFSYERWKAIVEINCLRRRYSGTLDRTFDLPGGDSYPQGVASPFSMQED